MPLLGVCLGHQGLGWVHGAQVVHAPELMHGRLSAVLHEDSPLFAGHPARVPGGPLPLALRRAAAAATELEPIAWTSDGVLMAVAHRTRPQWGVQFHPESICTEYGRQLLANFRDLTSERAAPAAHGGAARGRRPAGARVAPGAGRPGADASSGSTRSPTPSAPSSTSTARARTPSGSTAARSTSARASRSWARPAGRSARRSPTTSASGELTRRARRRGPRCCEESIFDYLSREMRQAALPLRRPAVRLQLRLRRLLRLRAEGRLRRRRTPTPRRCPTPPSCSPTG